MNGNTITTYFRGINLIYADKNGAQTYYHFNAHGDVVVLTNASGTKTKTYSYNAFGTEYNPGTYDTNPFRYCGEYYDTVSGTIYLRARYYNSDLGRFTQEDPIRDGRNWYTYCENNPLVYVDPLGTVTISCTLGVNATALFGFAFSIGYSYDYQGNIAFHYSYAFPQSNDTMYIGGLSAGVALGSQITCLDTVDQLAGPAGYIGASGGYMGYLGADAVFLPDNYEGLGINDSSWIGAQATVGLGIGADAHIMETNTVMSESFNAFEFIEAGVDKIGDFFKEMFR